MSMSILAIFNAKLKWRIAVYDTQHIIPRKTDANNFKALKLFYSTGAECGFGLYW